MSFSDYNNPSWNSWVCESCQSPDYLDYVYSRKSNRAFTKCNNPSCHQTNKDGTVKIDTYTNEPA